MRMSKCTFCGKVDIFCVPLPLGLFSCRQCCMCLPPLNPISEETKATMKKLDDLIKKAPKASNLDKMSSEEEEKFYESCLLNQVMQSMALVCLSEKPDFV